MKIKLGIEDKILSQEFHPNTSLSEKEVAKANTTDPTSKELFFVERKIEAFLNIDDKSMTGEFNPNLDSKPQNITEAINLIREGVKRNR